MGNVDAGSGSSGLCNRAGDIEMIKTMRLVRRPEPKHPRLLDTDAALETYQRQYDAMTSKYRIVGKPSWWRRLIRWMKGTR